MNNITSRNRTVSGVRLIFYCSLLVLILTLPAKPGNFLLTASSNASTSTAQFGLTASPYQLNKTTDIWLTAGGAVLLGAGLAVMNSVQPLSVEEINSLDKNDINKFDRQFMNGYREGFAGDLVLYTSFLMPLSFMAVAPIREDWQTIGVMGLQVIMIQSGINLMVKGLTSRTRPYAYDPIAPLEKKLDRSTRLSFYSGHTATTAAISFFTARVFSDYLDDGSTKTFIWSGAIAYSALAAYLRVASGHHYFTDVLVGYIVGATIGYVIPEIHKSMKTGKISFQQSMRGDGIRLNLVVNF